MSEWKTWTPECDGHAPDDWDGDKVEFKGGNVSRWRPLRAPSWHTWCAYRYNVKSSEEVSADATPDLLAQCLALPQADREALIEALQKPQRDWADDVWSKADEAFGNDGKAAAVAVIRSMCRPKEEN